ncbi:MAG: DNA polymerase III subunit delta [Candidatus Omnitrophica bacterium]|nr:DNA polymerase III subunit delta [Candidatus Omnitrophota bacterium]
MVNSKPSVFLFAGADSYSKEQEIKKLGGPIFKGSSRDLDYKVFDCGDDSSRDILDYISTVPFMSPKRLAVVKNFEELSDEDLSRLISYIKNPNKYTYLVIDAEDDSLLKDHPEILRHVIPVRFGELTDQQFQARTKQMLEPLKKSISPEGAKALKELYGPDMGSVSQELQKLSSFVGERGRIEAEDVEAAAGKHITASAFDLTDAIEVNDLKKALSIVSDLILSGKKHYEIVGLLCWQMKRLFRGRVLFEKGTSGTQIAGALRINKRYYDRFLKQLKASTLAGIEAKIKTLLEADLDIKRSRYDPAVALEFAVIKLCLGLR